MQSFCIFDTEYMTFPNALSTGWNDSGQHKEIIQIAAAIVTPGQPWETFPTFNVLVKPVLNRLNAHTTQITGITQEQMDADGMATATAMARFAAFVGDHKAFSNGMDINKIAETCGLQGVHMPLAVRNFGSLRAALYEALDEVRDFHHEDFPSGRLHELVGIPLLPGLGQVHDAMRDVWSLHVTMDWLSDHSVNITAMMVDQLELAYTAC
ncbi:MAG: hypothetical protein EON60_00630 [Alphaproteobacteria bacterium]|nr:MAG: hypothetical protein EON60_00630 [Alphaproteobacteria bacterium]